MRTLVDQLEQSLSSRLYYLSLFAALTIPDIAGALDSDDGQATGERYALWFDAWIRPEFAKQVLASLPPQVRSTIPSQDGPLTGDACYRFRCSLLHQGSSQHPKSPYTRIIFIEPGAVAGAIHGGIVEGALLIDLPTFCREVIGGTRCWLDRVEGSSRYETNYERFAKRHASGLSPYVGGVPVVG
jgi:hypothetical protein